MKLLASKKELAKQEKQKQEEIRRIRLPNSKNLEMHGLVVQLHGTNQVRVLAEDGVERMCRIPGKLKKRVWIREGDIVIIKLWDFQPSKADIIWRYIGFQVEYLKKKGYLDKLPL